VGHGGGCGVRVCMICMYDWCSGSSLPPVSICFNYEFSLALSNYRK